MSSDDLLSLLGDAHDAEETRAQRTTGSATIALPWTKPPLSLNDGGQTRGARMHKARRIREIRGDMVTLARKARLPKGVLAATITLHYRPRDNTRRDSINLAPPVKALVDGLTPQKIVETKTGRKVHPGYGFVDDDHTGIVSTPETVIHPAERGQTGALWLEITWET